MTYTRTGSHLPRRTFLNIKGAFLIFLAFLGGPAALDAQPQYTYTANADGTSITLNHFGGLGGSVIIPTNINGFTVTALGYAFYGIPLGSSVDVTSVVVPDSVTSIGDEAFYYSSATSVTLPESLTNFGASVFAFSSLRSVAIPNGITTLGDGMFAECANLTNVVIANSVTDLGGAAFSGCAKLTSVILPDNIVIIPRWTFANCGLTNMTFSSNVTSIGDSAFVGCQFTNIAISRAITNIGPGAFSSCTNLVAITVDEQNPVYRSINGVLFDKAQTTLVQYPTGLGGSYTIPAGVGNIGDSSFNGCVNMNLTIPTSVTNIQDFAFENSYLSNIVIPGSVTTIGDGAFELCFNLIDLTIPASVTSMYLSAVNYEPSLLGIHFMGNAPLFVPEIFSPEGTPFFYLPGTTGWSTYINNYAVPAVLWNPQIQTSDGGFGISNGQFGFNITGPQIRSLRVETCTNLSNPVWTPLTNLISSYLSTGSFYFSDPQWTNNPNRFYRLSIP